MNFHSHSSAAPAEFSPAGGLDPESWLERHGDYLFRFAVGQLRDSHTAEDLVQETLLAAMKNRERFSGRSSERTWLVGILRHKIYDHLRQTCRHRTVSYDGGTESGEGDPYADTVAWVHEVAGECLTPARRLELQEFREALEVGLGQLPPRIAQVFELYEIQEQSGAEVCRAMNISEANLWVMLHRGRKLLREQLAGWWTSRKSPASDERLNS